MKKIISVLLATIVLTLFVTISASAETNVSSQVNAATVSDTYIEHFDDGSYLVITIEQSLTPRASTYTKEGHKSVNFYNSDDELQWEYILVGTFKVTSGVSALCTNSTYEYTIHNSSWSLTDHNNTYSENAAYGTATFKKKVLFITTSTQNIDVRLMCDANGNLS